MVFGSSVLHAVHSKYVPSSRSCIRTSWKRDGHIDYDYLPYNETLYVPVVIERDQFAWVVYYVRVTGGDGSR